MTRSELIAQIAESYPELDSSVIQRVVETVFDEIADSLGRGNRVELRGFGTFAVRERRSRNARNPRTGEAVFVPRKFALHFKPGKLLREQLNS
ncbi:MAG: integration host factor subunit beta [Rhodobacteraceae bacterium]|nr:integration host factor subunit beta [Paracoccaceae bacterium]